MAVHRIRLRAPWKRERENDRDVWRRVFGCPSNLSSREKVRLVLRSESARATVLLNGEALGSAPAVFEVTASLEFRNRLTLTMEGCGEIEGEGREPPFDVSLEIESD